MCQGIYHCSQFFLINVNAMSQMTMRWKNYLRLNVMLMPRRQQRFKVEQLHGFFVLYFFLCNFLISCIDFIQTSWGRSVQPNFQFMGLPIFEHVMVMQFIETIAKKYIFQFMHIRAKAKFYFRRITMENRASLDAHSGCMGTRNLITLYQFLRASVKTLLLNCLRVMELF